jgi:hypothetical protein
MVYNNIIHEIDNGDIFIEFIKKINDKNIWFCNQNTYHLSIQNGIIIKIQEKFEKFFESIRDIDFNKINKIKILNLMTIIGIIYNKNLITSEVIDNVINNMFNIILNINDYNKINDIAECIYYIIGEVNDPKYNTIIEKLLKIKLDTRIKFLMEDLLDLSKTSEVKCEHLDDSSSRMETIINEYIENQSKKDLIMELKEMKIFRNYEIQTNFVLKLCDLILNKNKINEPINNLLQICIESKCLQKTGVRKGLFTFFKQLDDVIYDYPNYYILLFDLIGIMKEITIINKTIMKQLFKIITKIESINNVNADRSLSNKMMIEYKLKTKRY